jgi:hypothetical protein
MFSVFCLLLLIGSVLAEDYPKVFVEVSLSPINLMKNVC